MSFRKLAALVALLLATGLLAACGGDDDDNGGALSSDEYATEVDDQLTTFNEEFTSLGDAARDPESRKAYLDAVTAIRDRVTEVVGDLDAIEPPSDANEFHDNLVAAMRDLEESFTPVIDATEAKDDEALLEAVTDLQEANTEFASKANDLSAQAEEAGLEIPSLTGSG